MRTGSAGENKMQSLVEKLRGLARGGGSGGDVKITFSVPTPVASEPQPELGRLRLGKRDADQDGPLEYISACRKEARSLSRCTLAPSLTIAEMFVALHMVARFDILRWPTELHQFFFAYCKSVSFLSDLTEDGQGALPRNVSDD
jgi:hypothetical protein